MTSLRHTYQKVAHHILGDMAASTNTQEVFWKACLIHVWFSEAAEAVQEARALTQTPEPPKIIQEQGMLCRVFSNAEAVEEHSPKVLQEQSPCVTLSSLVLTEREHHLKVSKAWQILGSTWLQRQFCCSPRLRHLRKWQPFWVVAVALKLKSRLMPLLQAQPLCYHLVLLFWVALFGERRGKERLISLVWDVCVIRQYF